MLHIIQSLILFLRDKYIKIDDQKDGEPMTNRAMSKNFIKMVTIYSLSSIIIRRALPESIDDIKDQRKAILLWYDWFIYISVFAWIPYLISTVTKFDVFQLLGNYFQIKKTEFFCCNDQTTHEDSYKVVDSYMGSLFSK